MQALFPNEDQVTQVNYAGRINFFVRDDVRGTGGTFRADKSYIIPDLNETVDLEYAQQYLDYPECGFYGNNLLATPCLYVADRASAQANEAETYETISRYFYTDEAYAECIQKANKTIYSLVTDSFEPTKIVGGVVVVIPDRKGCNG